MKILRIVPNTEHLSSFVRIYIEGTDGKEVYWGGMRKEVWDAIKELTERKL
jgi:hypothetical protein